MKNTLILCLAACVIVGCGSGKGKAQTKAPIHTITDEGVGTIPITFPGDKILKLEGYTVNQNENRSEFTVTDSDGKVVITRVEGMCGILKIHAPHFTTQAGIGVGSDVGEMINAVGKCDIYGIVEEAGEYYMYVSRVKDQSVGFYVNIDQLKDPSKRNYFDNNPNKLTVKDFKPDAKVELITISEINVAGMQD